MKDKIKKIWSQSPWGTQERGAFRIDIIENKTSGMGTINSLIRNGNKENH